MEKKTPIFLERVIREQILLLSPSFEPQIKSIIKRLDSLYNISISLLDSPFENFPLLSPCPLCSKQFSKTSLTILHMIFVHRNIKFEFKLEQKDSYYHILKIKGIRKELAFIKETKDNSGFFYCGKQRNNNNRTKQIRYHIKLLVQNTIKKVFIAENTLVKQPKVNNSIMFLSDSDEEDRKKSKEIINKKLSNEEIKKKLEGKVFYHSKNIMEPIKDDSLFEESELDIDDRPIRESEEKAINDFEDIDETDKEFFKLWNNFVRDFNKPKKKIDDIKKARLVAFNKRDNKPLLSEFVTKNKVVLEKLRYNFVMHLITFQIYGLINGNDILQLLLELDDKRINLL